MKITDEQIKVTKEIFIDFFKKNTKKEISPKDIFSHKKWRWNKNIKISELLIKSGINPDCVLDNQRGKFKNDVKFLKRIMVELSSIVGRENLNDYSLHKFGMIDLPKSLQTKGKFPFSEKLKIPLKKVNTNSLTKSISRTFGNLSWGEILELSGYKNVEKRKSNFNNQEILILLKKFVKENYKIKWDKYKNEFTEHIKPHEFKTVDNRLFKLINRIPKKLNVKMKNKNINQFSLGLFILMFTEEKIETQNLMEYLNKYEKQIEKYSLGGRLIKKRKGNESDIQKSILQGYVNGFFGYGDYFGEPTLYRYINQKIKDNSKLYFKKIGIETDSLRYLKNVIESKYNSKEKIWIKFRELVSISIQTNSNCLTREYLEKNEPEFIRDCFRLEKIKTNSWENILKEYGLSPDIWSNSYSIISHKGNVFQKSVYELFGKHLIEVKDISHLDRNSFIHNRLISVGIKPDFIFKDFIVDTKLSVSIDKNKQIGNVERIQIEKYLKYFERPVYIITLNQHEEYFLIDNFKIRNINFRTDFTNWVSSQFSIKLMKNEISDIFSRVNNIPFWKI